MNYDTGYLGCWIVQYQTSPVPPEYSVSLHDLSHIIHDEDGNASRRIGTTQDITARKSAENKLIQERLAKQNEITNALLTALYAHNGK